MDRRPQFLNGVVVPYDAPVSELRTRLHPPGPHTWAACVALGMHPDRDAFALLVELAVSKDWSYRRAAVEALANHPLGREAVALVGTHLNDPSRYVARAACRTAAALGLHILHDAVAALLRAEEAATRNEALRTLATLWQPTDFAPVFACFHTDTSEEVRRQAAWTLRAHASADNWQHLFEAWRRDPVPRHRTWAAELATTLGDREVEQQLRELREDPDGHVRRAAREALRRLGEGPRVTQAGAVGEIQ